MVYFLWGELMIYKNKDINTNINEKTVELGNIGVNFYTEDEGTASIRIYINWNNKPVDLNKINMKPVLSLFMQDGSIFEGEKVEVILAEKGLIQYKIPSNVIKHVGKVNAKLFLVNDNESIHVANFNFEISDSGVEEPVKKELSFNLLDEAIKQIVSASAMELLDDTFKLDVTEGLQAYVKKNAILFKGDKGEKGEQGPQGPQGEPGKDGEKGESVKADFLLDSNSSIPSKTLATGNNFKLVNKLSSDELVVYQKAYNNYLRYYLKRNSGGSGYGVNYELLRVQKVEPISNVMVYKDVSTPDEGVVTSVWNYTGTNSVEARAMPNKSKNNKIRYTDSMNKPIQSYEIKPKTSVSYNLQPTMANTMNVAMYARGGYTSNENFNLKIDGEIIQELNIKNAPMQYTRVYNFNVPPTDSNFKLTIENTSEKSVYLTGLNMYSLEDYKRQEINQFVAYGQTNVVNFIDNAGASDYAFKNLETNELFGSYHGGEKVQSCKLEYIDMKNLIENVKQIQFADIEVGKFYLTPNLTIKQESILIERANVYSRFNFNDNGTLIFDISYNIIEGKAPIPIKDFHVGLTCTNSAFSKVKYPIIKNFGSTYTGDAVYFNGTSSQIIQTTDSENQELHIRHTRYKNDYVYTNTPFSIYDLELYRKYYYAPIRNNTDKNIAPTSFQFTKALDFYTL